MPEVEVLDWHGMTYDDVDRRLHELAGIPIRLPFADMTSTVFRGTVPRTITSKVFDAIEYAHNIYSPNTLHSRSEIESSYRYFRNESFFGNMFPSDKPLHGRRFRRTLIFDTSAYEDTTHENNIAVFQRLARIWEGIAVSIRLYDIRKDIHTELYSRNSLTPFVRNHIAFLVVDLHTT
jgi:hypothetical protein